MTGIERLRRLAGSQDTGNAWTAMLANELTDIDDQIERETQPKRDHAAIAWVRDHGATVAAVAEEMCVSYETVRQWVRRAGKGAEA